MILFHEYTHRFLHQYFPLGYRNWLSEGCAEYICPTEIEPTTVNIGEFSPERASWLFAHSWVPIKDRLSKKAWVGNSEQRLMLYSGSWLLTQYMFATPERRQQLSAYLRAIAAGQDSVASMEKATGMTTEELQKALPGYQKIVYRHITRPERVEAEVKVAPLSDAADDLLLLDVRNSEPIPSNARADY